MCLKHSYYFPRLYRVSVTITWKMWPQCRSSDLQVSITLHRAGKVLQSYRKRIHSFKNIRVQMPQCLTMYNKRHEPGRLPQTNTFLKAQSSKMRGDIQRKELLRTTTFVSLVLRTEAGASVFPPFCTSNVTSLILWRSSHFVPVNAYLS